MIKEKAERQNQKAEMIEIDDHIKKNPLLLKSFLLALEIVKIYKHLTEAKHEYVMSKQLLKAGTSACPVK